MDDVRTAFKTLQIARRRPRSNTHELLGPDHPILPTTIDLPAFPQPETDFQAYTEERLQRGLQYVASKLKRNIIPRTKAFLINHKKAYKAALQATESDRLTCLASVQTLEKVFNSESFLHNDYSQTDMTPIEAIRKFRELEILANYGDYLSHEVQGFRNRLFIPGADEGEEEILSRARPAFGNQKLWTEIADILKIEEEKIAELSKASHDDDYLKTNISYILRRSCYFLGIDSEHMRWAIQEYANRNRKFHNNINDYISNCSWHDLARQISKDLADLPMVMDLKAIPRYERSIKNIRDKYFDVGDFPNDPQNWYPNSHAKELAKEKAAAEQKRQAKLKRQAESEDVLPEEGKQSRRSRRKEKRLKTDAGTQTSPQAEPEFMGFGDTDVESEWEGC